MEDSGALFPMNGKGAMTYSNINALAISRSNALTATISDAVSRMIRQEVLGQKYPIAMDTGETAKTGLKGSMEGEWYYQKEQLYLKNDT